MFVASLSVVADNAISDQKADLTKSTPVPNVTSSSTENGVTSQSEIGTSTAQTFPLSIFPENQVEVNETARKILLGFENKTTTKTVEVEFSTLKNSLSNFSKNFIFFHFS